MVQAESRRSVFLMPRRSLSSHPLGCKDSDFFAQNKEKGWKNYFPPYLSHCLTLKKHWGNIRGHLVKVICHFRFREHGYLSTIYKYKYLYYSGGFWQCFFSILTNDHDQMTAPLKNLNFSSFGIREPQWWCRTFATSIWEKKSLASLR